MKYNYVEIGKRIRLEREKLNLSQEKLLNNIRENGRPCIGRNTLSKIENGDEKAFNAINLAQIISICEEFDCSISFLFGEYNYRDYDNKFICEKTGLVEANLLKILGEKNDFLNAFLSSQHFYQIDYSYEQLQQAIKCINQCIASINCIEKKASQMPKDSLKYKELNRAWSDTMSAAERWEGLVYYNIYKMGIDFGNILEDMKTAKLKKAPDTN